MITLIPFFGDRLANRGEGVNALSGYGNPAARTFAPNAVHMVRTAQAIHVQLSAMADQKASILMGASFVIFTITIN